MKYASIDIETTGVNEDTCNVIEIGIVVDDLKDPKPLDELPTEHCYVLPPDEGYSGEPYALSMHSDIFYRIANLVDDYNYLEPREVGPYLYKFLDKHFPNQDVVAAGKNFGSFDLQFLKKLPNFSNHVNFHHRTLDPSGYYVDLIEDSVPPNLKKCLERAKIEGEIAHTALEDALDVVRLIRVAAFGTVDPNQ
jgi:oligoribonuclease (3'-5' exoribonuclease)